MDNIKSSKKTCSIGLDVGSTTVKAVVLDDNQNIIWQDYQRHNSKQAESVLGFLERIETDFEDQAFSIFTTGNGGRALAPLLGANHIQEVNAVSCAVETLYPAAGSVVELGGQDAKVIIWKKDKQGRKNSVFFMNDKCAGGTGATFDKIFAKIDISENELRHIRAEGKTVHHIAAKCGVFAETDVVGLLKAGIPKEEIVVSLCTAIVKQNIEVLLHGNTLRDDVLLLGGPHTYLPVLSQIWQQQIPLIWNLHKWRSKDRPVSSLVYVPDNAQYFAAIGAVLFGEESLLFSSEIKTALPTYLGREKLLAYLDGASQTRIVANGAVQKGIVSSKEECEAFVQAYSPAPFDPPKHNRGDVVPGFIGIDGGSTSSKMAFVSPDGILLYKDYLLSKGNPILDVREMFKKFLAWQIRNGIKVEITGTAVTGYASEILQKAFKLDVSIVETVAHLNSAKHYYGDVDVICDVGGQDIKVLIMKHGRVVDIRLNTQCSAGNGYFLQNMAEQFGVPVEQYAERAFSVRQAPSFNYGCAVFMEQDKVNFQQLGWTKDEIMAGLALVLPLNIWNYVVQETNISRLGKRFLLQGGTQKNLAAVKTQVDYIKSKVKDATVMSHEHADVAGAIGAAIEAMQTMKSSVVSTFVGVKKALNVSFKSKNDATTVCTFCSNRCQRTFIDISVEPGKITRHILGYGCEKGLEDNVADMKKSAAEKRQLKQDCPNLVHDAAIDVFKEYPVAPIPSGLLNSAAAEKRSQMVVGIPKLLNLYVYAPFFNSYFRALGIKKVVYSDYTSQKLWDTGNKFGAIDPCFPAKVAPAHIYNLMQKQEVTHICFPMITHLESMVKNTLGNNACVIQMGTSEVVEAAFTKKGRDYFKGAGIEFWKPLLPMDRPAEAEGNLFEYFETVLSLTSEENAFAVKQGYQAMEQYFSGIRRKGANLINELVKNDKMGILFIGHPYHHDPGFNHGILESFQMLGYPVLCIESLPTTDDFLKPLFAESDNSFDITDIWERNFNRNTNAKIWAARIAARHPNLAVIDLSSFKCGHDAPTYSYVDSILDASKTPHFLFHDIDQNKPSATIGIRIQSIDYFLKLEEARLKEYIQRQQIEGQKAV